jgi:hypothetical protein
MGPAVVPLLLRDLEENRTHWFCALREITGANPIPGPAAGNITQMVEAWLQWARKNGYLTPVQTPPDTPIPDRLSAWSSDT